MERCFAALWVLGVIPWLLLVVPSIADADHDWYRRHQLGDTDSTDLWVVFLKFHPLAYAHVFLFGMVLARLRQKLLDAPEASPLAQFLSTVMKVGATAGYFVLLVVFLARDARPVAHKLSCRLSILMPLQAMILIGLSPAPGAQVIDPVYLLFRKVPSFFEDISYPQYVLQFVAYALWPEMRHIEVFPFLCAQCGNGFFSTPGEE